MNHKKKSLNQIILKLKSFCIFQNTIKIVKSPGTDRQLKCEYIRMSKSLLSGIRIDKEIIRKGISNHGNAN